MVGLLIMDRMVCLGPRLGLCIGGREWVKNIVEFVNAIPDKSSPKIGIGRGFYLFNECVTEVKGFKKGSFMF
jgi:hypothetical protein